MYKDSQNKHHLPHHLSSPWTGNPAAEGAGYIFFDSLIKIYDMAPPNN